MNGDRTELAGPAARGHRVHRPGPLGAAHPVRPRHRRRRRHPRARPAGRARPGGRTWSRCSCWPPTRSPGSWWCASALREPARSCRWRAGAASGRSCCCPVRRARPAVPYGRVGGAGRRAARRWAWTPTASCCWSGWCCVQLSTGNVLVRLVLSATGTMRPDAPGGVQGPARTLKGGRLLGPLERLFILGLGAGRQPHRGGDRGGGEGPAALARAVVTRRAGQGAPADRVLPGRLVRQLAGAAGWSGAA